MHIRKADARVHCEGLLPMNDIPAPADAVVYTYEGNSRGADMRSRGSDGVSDPQPRPLTSPRGLAPLVFALGAALLLAACGEAQWTATVYPDRENLNDFDRIGVFADLDSCRAAATEAAGLLGAAGDIVPGWECGQNCAIDYDGDLRCDKYEQG